MADSPITAKRSYRERSVAVNVEMRAHGYATDSVNIKGSTTITTDAARKLAADLVALADEADAKAAKKEAAKERRGQWLDREIAAGRVKRMSLADVFGRKGDGR